MKKVKIRYNTENTTDLFWRLIIDDVEKLVTEIKISCPSWTSKDTLTDGRIKYHIACDASLFHWSEDGKTVEIF